MGKLLSGILVFAVFFISCSRYDLRDRDDFGRYVLDVLTDPNNSNKDFYIMPSDTINTSDSSTLFSLKYLSSDTSIFHKYIKRQNEGIKEWRKKAVDIALNKNNIDFLRTEFDTLTDYPVKHLKVFFLLDKKEHFFMILSVDSLNNKWGSFFIEPPTNQKEVDELERKENERIADEAYTPRELHFTSVNWEFYHASPKEFTHFYVTLKNGTFDNFNKIKYSVSIYKKGYTEEVFSRTFERYENIYAGDMIRFEVTELRGYYLGINITNKQNFEWNAQLLDAKPRPGYEEYYND